jgi:hypothetical protein
MENGLFRQKSIDRISSPESLHDYMRVTTPRLWMILAAIILLLVGFLVFASMTKMENTLALKVTVETYDSGQYGGTAGEKVTSVSCVLKQDQAEQIKTGMKLQLGTETGVVENILNSAEGNESYIFFRMDNRLLQMKDGDYDAQLVLESASPISFLWSIE